jgi:hypothetical protein
LAEGEIGKIGFGKAAPMIVAGEDTAGRDMGPRDGGAVAGFLDEGGEQGVAKKTVGFVEFAGVDVGFAGVSGTMDDPGGTEGVQKGSESAGNLGAPIGPDGGAEWQTARGERRLEGPADVAGGTQEKDHGRRASWTGNKRFIEWET